MVTYIVIVVLQKEKREKKEIKKKERERKREMFSSEPLEVSEMYSLWDR